MRAHRDRSSTTLRVLIILIVAVVAFGLATGPAAAGIATGKPETPLDAFHRFQFELEMGVTVGTDGPPIKVVMKGSYVGPK